MINWSNFYTPIEIASEIVNLIPSDYTPNCIIDICSGSGNFLDAAKMRWNSIPSIGVDIESKSTKTDKDTDTSLTFIKANALDYSNLDILPITNPKLILANPPFGKTDYIPTQVCQKHTLLHYEAIKSKRIETLMIVSNMYLLKDDEIFAAILPENIFSSKKLENFKSIFLSYFDVKYLGEPKKYFLGSEVKTRIFIGRYLNISSNNITLDKRDNISSNIIAYRGIDNSKLLKSQVGYEKKELTQVIHFSNKDGDLKLTRYIQKDLFSSDRTVQKNDLLIARVGRSSGRVFKVKKDYIGKYASDYFYVVKNILLDINEEDILKLEEQLLSLKKGLTAKYLCKEDILKQISFFIR
ncbi:N-6 DNA methylase [Flavobacterium amniphilum]|uniref:N-6 DNA methylase n=1 Tax=Flavobacterium amniphilum TaxID=1834035 RepID=UPI00202A4457|nr:N-6 DNA methylase [Flavobacterium amniphilum]MCL9807453.1 N-6 DNA methylase [Flavobacterium amniphilum]